MLIVPLPLASETSCSWTSCSRRSGCMRAVCTAPAGLLCCSPAQKPESVNPCSGSFGGAALESRKFSIRPGARAQMPAISEPSFEDSQEPLDSTPLSADPQRAALLRGVASQRDPPAPLPAPTDPQRAALLRGVYGEKGPPVPPASSQVPRTSQDPMRAQLFASMSSSQAAAGRPPGPRTAEDIKLHYRHGSVQPKYGPLVLWVSMSTAGVPA